MVPRLLLVTAIGSGVEAMTKYLISFPSEAMERREFWYGPAS